MHGWVADRLSFDRREQGGSGGWSWGEEPDRYGDFDARDRGGHQWRYGQGGGYEVYHTAGRDRDGYLVWAGRPRL